MKKPHWSVESSHPSVVTVRAEISPSRDMLVLLRGDAHHDNPHCNQKLERKHLEQAKERGAGIIDVGDLFCAMQGRYDKRANKSIVRPEHQHGDYLDRLVSTASEFYEPYAHNWIVFGQGNHETAIYERLETNLTERLCERLRDRTKALVVAGGYSGWVRFMFTRGDRRCSRRLWYFHGSGGGGPVTLDTIQGQRQTAYVENADVMVTGHTHDSWAIERTKIRLNDAGVVEHRPVWQVKVPTYKDEYGSGVGGWHVQTGKPPKPTGAYWLRFYMSNDEIHTEITKAQA